jgi:hypothetical protein
MSASKALGHAALLRPEEQPVHGGQLNLVVVCNVTSYKTHAC